MMHTGDSDPFLLFEFADREGRIRPLRFSKPDDVVMTDSVDQVVPALKKIQNAVDDGFYAAGYVSYEAAPAFDRRFAVHADPKMPLLWFGIFRNPCVSKEPVSNGTYQFSNWQSSTTMETYESNISTIIKKMDEEHTDQVNYTMRLRSEFRGDDLSFYRQLSNGQDSNYCAYMNIGRFRILSASPELFFRWHGNQITTRPMKGTVGRGRWKEEDDSNASWLYHSEKNRSENAMIVDLLRRDLSHIAKTGSVHVPRLFHIERYPTVIQMTSTVTAETKRGTKLADIFRALFPSGSITGVPKMSALNMIAEFEDSPRETYCGALGYMAPDGEAVFNVPIRTVVIDTKTGIAEYGTGGAVTTASTPDAEYREAFTKAKLLTENLPPFELLESIRLDHGTYFLYQRHLQRLKHSAAYVGFHLPMDHIHKRLRAYANENADDVRKVRLLVSKEGDITVSGEPVTDLHGPVPVKIAKTPVNKNDRFLYHKTTYRDMYEARRSEEPGVFDVILWNEQGELTEFTNGNLVLELDGEKWTPPREAGLLDGTFRQELLSNGRIKERTLTKKDLHVCTNAWFINSVRKWVPVRVIP